MPLPAPSSCRATWLEERQQAANGSGRLARRPGRPAPAALHAHEALEARLACDHLFCLYVCPPALFLKPAVRTARCLVSTSNWMQTDGRTNWAPARMARRAMHADAEKQGL